MNNRKIADINFLDHHLNKTPSNDFNRYSGIPLFGCELSAFERWKQSCNVPYKTENYHTALLNSGIHNDTDTKKFDFSGLNCEFNNEYSISTNMFQYRLKGEDKLPVVSEKLPPFAPVFAGIMQRRRRLKSRPRRQRTTFSSDQTVKLEVEYSRTEYITRPRRYELAELLNLTENQIKIWFQNRRAKEKRIEKAHLDHQLRNFGTRPQHTTVCPIPNCSIPEHDAIRWAISSTNKNSIPE